MKNSAYIVWLPSSGMKAVTAVFESSIVLVRLSVLNIFAATLSTSIIA